MNWIGKKRAIALVLLIVGFTSCEKEALNGSATIHFTLSDSAYGPDEMRRAGPVRMEPETVVVPVEGDLYAYTTLEEADESPLRAPGDATLAVGTRVQIVVYNSATDAYVNSFEYEVTDAAGAIAPVGATTGLTLTTGNYNFVAYSFNTTSVPGYAASITDGAPYSPNADASDPLWGISGPHSITAGGTYNIALAMKHQYSRVTFKATTDGMEAPVPTIGAIDAKLLGYQATEMTVLSGALTKGTAENQAFVFPTLNLSTVTAPSRMVYAGGESTTSVLIASATVGGDARTWVLPVKFNRKLEPGKSYTLKVSFESLHWAYSNIYWDAGAQKLTFDTTDQGNQGYQGVFFRWGSLVGISPAQVEGSNEFVDQSVPIYVPVVADPLTASTWKATTTTTVASDVANVSSNYSTWDNGGIAVRATDIPYLDSSYPGTGNSRSSTFVMDAVRNTQEVYEGLRGDICQYLSKTGAVSGNYRMPMGSELGTVNSSSFSTTTPAAGGWLKGDGSFELQTVAGKPDGTADFLDATKNNAGKKLGSAKNITMGNVTLPASGERSMDGGKLQSVGQIGEYFSGSSSSSNISGYYFLFSVSSGLGVNNAVRRAYAMPIRCVKN
jgi:hypothetical protein